MKRILMLGLAMSLSVLSFSQTRARISNALVNKSVQREYIPYKDGHSSIPAQPENRTTGRRMSPDETQLGTTYYDLQTNASLSNRFYWYDDGKIASVWTRAMTEAGDWPDRGTGYNFFDGTDWMLEPTTRIESVPTSSPTYAPLGAEGEIVISQDSANLRICKRTPKGTGAWIESSMAGPSGTNLICPKVVTNGTDHNTLHLLAALNDAWLGQSHAMLYSRSQDGGVTWDINCTVIPGTGADSYSEIGGDEYVWAEPRGNKLAFLVSSKWHDMFMMKSTDNGNTWTKTVIWQHPYPMWNWNTTITSDTIWCPESSSITLDFQGKAHVAFGIGRVAHTSAGNSFTFWPYTDGIGYWNEDMPPFTNANQHKALCTYPGYLVGNVNLIGWMQDMDADGLITLIDPPYSYNPQIGLSTMPSISIDENNNVFVAFATTMECYDNTIYNYKHIWMRASSDGGHMWSGFVDANQSPIHAFDECILPQLFAGPDDYLHLMYNADDTPGLALSDPPDHNPQENRQNYAIIEKYGFYFITVYISTSSNPVSGGTTTGGGLYYYGSMVNLLATPNSHYNFLNWSENGDIVSYSAAYSFIAYDNLSMVANFYPYEGILSDQSNAIKIYPNPTSGQLIIESDTHAAETLSEISLINATGCLVYKKTSNFTDKLIIDLTGKASGIYNLRIVLSDGSFNVFKIVCTK